MALLPRIDRLSGDIAAFKVEIPHLNKGIPPSRHAVKSRHLFPDKRSRSLAVIQPLLVSQTVNMFGSKLFLAVSAIALALADDNAVTVPKAPGLTFLYSTNVTLGTVIEYGAGPRGNRVAIPITGGPVVGPRINGTNLISSFPSPY